MNGGTDMLKDGKVNRMPISHPAKAGATKRINTLRSHKYS